MTSLERHRDDLVVCFLGGARYSQPLDETSAKKFRALAALGHLFVVGFSRDRRPRVFSEHARFYLMPGLGIPLLRYAELFGAGPGLLVWLIARHGVEILVAQSPYEGCAGAVAKAFARALGYKVRLVVESHGDFEESLFLHRRVWTPGLYRFVMRRAARFAIARADSLRAISGSTRRQLERWAQGRPVRQFPTWTDLDVFLRCGTRENADSTQRILCAGALIPRKGLDVLLGAFARLAGDLPAASLTIVGREENRSYAAELKARVSSLGLDGRVRFAGELAQRDLAEWMRRATVFVLPSRSEGLGRVVVEAMATGCPVVGSRVGGILEIVQDGVTGFLVPPDDEAMLAEQIRWILSHPGEAREMGRRARAFAESFFSTEAYVTAYAELFAEASSRTGAARSE